MTIDELLEMAQHNLAMIEGAIGGETVTRYAAIAQAAALTAQAMMMREQMQDIAANNERAELRELWRQ